MTCTLHFNYISLCSKTFAQTSQQSIEITSTPGPGFMKILKSKFLTKLPIDTV